MRSAPPLVLGGQSPGGEASTPYVAHRIWPSYQEPPFLQALEYRWSGIESFASLKANGTIPFCFSYVIDIENGSLFGLKLHTQAPFKIP